MEGEVHLQMLWSKQLHVLLLCFRGIMVEGMYWYITMRQYEKVLGEYLRQLYVGIDEHVSHDKLSHPLISKLHLQISFKVQPISLNKNLNKA